MGEKFMGYLDDDENGIRQSVYYEEQRDRLIIRESQDVSAILKDNRRLRNEEDGKPFGEWKRIAQIPLIIVNDLMKKGIWGDKIRLKKWLNKTEFKHLRTKNGQI